MAILHDHKPCSKPRPQESLERCPHTRRSLSSTHCDDAGIVSQVVLVSADLDDRADPSHAATHGLGRVHCVQPCLKQSSQERANLGLPHTDAHQAMTLTAISLA